MNYFLYKMKKSKKTPRCLLIIKKYQQSFEKEGMSASSLGADVQRGGRDEERRLLKEEEEREEVLMNIACNVLETTILSAADPSHRAGYNVHRALTTHETMGDFLRARIDSNACTILLEWGDMPRGEGERLLADYDKLVMPVETAYARGLAEVETQAKRVGEYYPLWAVLLIYAQRMFTLNFIRSVLSDPVEYLQWLGESPGFPVGAYQRYQTSTHAEDSPLVEESRGVRRRIYDDWRLESYESGSGATKRWPFSIRNDTIHTLAKASVAFLNLLVAVNEDRKTIKYHGPDCTGDTWIAYCNDMYYCGAMYSTCEFWEGLALKGLMACSVAMSKIESEVSESVDHHNPVATPEEHRKNVMMNLASLLVTLRKTLYKDSLFSEYASKEGLWATEEPLTIERLAGQLRGFVNSYGIETQGGEPAKVDAMSGGAKKEETKEKSSPPEEPAAKPSGYEIGGVYIIPNGEVVMITRVVGSGHKRQIYYNKYNLGKGKPKGEKELQLDSGSAPLRRYRPPLTRKTS